VGRRGVPTTPPPIGFSSHFSASLEAAWLLRLPALPKKRAAIATAWLLHSSPSPLASDALSFNSVYCFSAIVGYTTRLSASLDFADSMVFAMVFARLIGLYCCAVPEAGSTTTGRAFARNEPE